MRSAPAAWPAPVIPTSGMSAADLMAVLLAKYLRYDFERPQDPHNDRLIFSKGHASTLLYAMFRAAGAISEDELLTLPAASTAVFEGHPTPRIPWVDVATGSLGQGLPYAVGMALAGKRLDRLPFRVWMLCGDSEIAEGRSGRRSSTRRTTSSTTSSRSSTSTGSASAARRCTAGTSTRTRTAPSAFGCHAIEIDGHDVEAIDRAYERGARHVRAARRDRRENDQGQGRHGDRGQERLSRQAARTFRAR